MSKKMWNKIFKSSKSTKNAKISPAAATVAVKTNKRCSIYEEYQQLNGYAGPQAETTKKPKKLEAQVVNERQQNLQQEAEEQQLPLNKMLQQHEAHVDGCDASATTTELNKVTAAATTSVNSSEAKNSEIAQMFANNADALLPTTTAHNNNNAPAQAAALAGANDQLIGNKNNSNNNSKQQSTFSKVVNSFTLKRNNNNSNGAAQKQQQQQKQKKDKENGNVNATGKFPKCEFVVAAKHATPTNQHHLNSSSHALQLQQAHYEAEAMSFMNAVQQQHADKRSSQVLIVIQQIVTSSSMPKMLSDTIPAATAHDAAQLSLTNKSQATVAVSDTAESGVGAARPMHSSATHDNVFILAAKSATTTTVTTTYSAPTLTKTNIRTTKIATTTTTNATNKMRLSIASTHVEKNNSNTIANTADPYPDAPAKLVPCPICQRTFNPVTLQKHVGICEKMATKKRNIFDSSRQRREGTELASYPLPKNFGLPTAKQEPRGQSPKPLQHISSPILARKKSNGGDELTRSTARASMRKLAANTTAHSQALSPGNNTAPNNATDAAGVGGSSTASLANNQMITSTASTHSLPGAGSFTRDRMRSSDRALAKRIQQPPAAEQCPHCERCFGLKAYDRHVEWCKEKALQASIKQTSKTEQNLAKERLEARTKYRAPCLKTKRSINRDKYAGLAGDEIEFGDHLKTAYGNHSNNTSNSNNNTSNSNNNTSNIGAVNGVASNDNSNSNGIGNSNGIMSLSMTSSMASERKPATLKDFNTSLGSRKTHRNAIELPPPSPTHHVGGIGIDDYVKSACFDNLRLTGSHLSAIKKKIPKRRITLNALNMQPQQQQTSNVSAHTPLATTSHAPPQSPQLEKARSRTTYDERLSTTTTSDHTREHNLGDANALSATLTYTACPLQAVTKARTQARNTTQPSKSRTRMKPTKVNAEQQQGMRVDAATFMTDHEEAMPSDATLDIHNSQAYESQLQQKQRIQRQPKQQQQQLQQQHQQNFQQQLQRYAPTMLTAPMQQMLQQRQTTFDKLPNTTIAMATLETATSSTASTSHTKLEVNAIRSLTICRPKRKKLVRQSISSHTTPMKAIPLLKESIEIFGAPTKMLNTVGGIGVGSDGDDIEELKDARDGMQADEETDDEIKVIKAPPKLARDKSFVLSGLPSADGYDPFLSAKRQLEELCSSSPPNNPSLSTKLPKNSTQTPMTTTGLHAKMSTSLTLSTSLTKSSPLTTINSTQNQRNATAPSLATQNKATTTSNFRRASSLRGPRRSPLLSSRPLFAQNHRPTIQRGLSDEGPISTNFLKPEEYDEMPVRSVCVNDYALTKSPRVTRRDNSLSNRKQSLKLNVQGATSTTPSATTPGTNSTLNTPNYAAMLGVNSSDELMNSTAKYLSKTDSLAAFLKYEKELDKLNAQTAAADALTHMSGNANVCANKPADECVPLSPAANLNNPVITKEFKDKSNTLSKQNSAKSLKAEQIETPKLSAAADKQDQARAFQHLPTPVPKTPPANGLSPYDRESVSAQKSQPLRLEPIISLPQATSTPITKSNSTRVLTTPNTTTYTQLPAVNLNALLGDTKAQLPLTTSLSAFSRERDIKNSSSSSDYIDPKLINKCDNLPVKLNTGRTLKSLSVSNNIERHLDFSSSSSECSATQTAPVSQLTKLQPLTRPATAHGVAAQTQPAVTMHSQAMDIPTRPATTDGAQQPPNVHTTLSQRSSAEGRNLLNRKKRLGRNHFLYDASPEADDSCSADDEANRSSVEYFESKYRSAYQQQQQQQRQHEPNTPFVNMSKESAPLETQPVLPPLPIFDDFDFEEFLSSFENDDEQLPLFKDCREFLLNRTSNKQRSTLTKPSSRNDDNYAPHTNNNNKNQHNTTQQQQTKDYNNTNNHFDSPNSVSNKHSHPTLPLTPSLHRSHDESRPKNQESSPISARYEELKRSNSNHNNNNNTQGGAYADDMSPLSRRNDSEHKKREIFISIETEPNEHGRSPISPESLRNMVGNPQTMVEVEVDGCDNKFSKISDDDEQFTSTHGGGSKKTHVEDMMKRCTPYASGNHLPNVQLNNAKNLIQRMQNDFRQMSEEVGANIRQAMTGITSISGSSGSMFYGGDGGGENMGMSGGGGVDVHGASTYLQRNVSSSLPPPPPSASSTVAANVGGSIAPSYATSGDVSGDACGDSDDMSSLDGYPISSKSSRRGVGAKLSADSAYGSLSRQRSSELSTTHQRSATRSRPSTSASTVSTNPMLPTKLTNVQHYEQQQQYHYQQQQLPQQLQQQTTQLYKYAPVKTRPRQVSGSSSSENSDGSDCNMKYKQKLQQQPQQQQHQQIYGGVGSNNNNNYMSSHYAPAAHHNSNLMGDNSNKNNNHNNISSNNNYESPLSSPTMPTTTTTTNLSTTNTAAVTADADLQAPATSKAQYSSNSSLSSTNASAAASMSASMKMSKFCHECGAKFLIEQAKFCMDCGVRRIVL